VPVLHEIPFSDFVATRSPRLLNLAYLRCGTSEFACSLDIGPQSRPAHGGLSPALGSTVKVTVVPLHATRPWSVYLMGTMPPLPSS
jgi:hypothetical protein